MRPRGDALRGPGNGRLGRSGLEQPLQPALGHLRDALVGRSFVGPIATGQERPHVGGLPGMLAGWKGSGGDAYREHLGKIGKQIEDLITDASNVSGALTRIEGDIRKVGRHDPDPAGGRLRVQRVEPAQRHRAR